MVGRCRQIRLLSNKMSPYGSKYELLSLYFRYIRLVYAEIIGLNVNRCHGTIFSPHSIRGLVKFTPISTEFNLRYTYVLLTTSTVKSYLALWNCCFYASWSVAYTHVCTCFHIFCAHACWCLLSVFSCTPASPPFMVLEVVMLSWSLERSQQSGKSIRLSSASLREEEEEGGGCLCVCGWVCSSAS